MYDNLRNVTKYAAICFNDLVTAMTFTPFMHFNVNYFYVDGQFTVQSLNVEWNDKKMRKKITGKLHTS